MKIFGLYRFSDLSFLGSFAALRTIACDYRHFLLDGLVVGQAVPDKTALLLSSSGIA